MKFNFKKVASVLASVTLVGSTMGFAAAATYPAPFVSGNSADVAVVVGSSAANSDMLAATDIGASLSSGLVTGSVAGSTPTGENIQLSRSSDEFNLRDAMDDFVLSLDDDDLPGLLANLEYENGDNKRFDYEQKIELMTLNLTHFRDSDYENYEPAIGFHISKGDTILNYTLEFTPTDAEGGSAWANLEDSFIEILGKEYYISDVTNQSTGNPKITLLDTAAQSTLGLAETKTIDLAGESYDVMVQAMDSNGVVFVVNGEAISKMSVGDTKQLSGTDHTYIALTEFVSKSFSEDQAYVKFALGNGETVLENGKEVEINGDAVSNTDEYDNNIVNFYVSVDGEDLEKFVLEWKADDDLFITPTSELSMPAFGEIKFTMNEFVTSSEEKTTFNTGDPLSISTTIKEGPITLDILYLNSTDDGFGTTLGTDSATVLITNSSTTTPHVVLNTTDSNYFVASWKSSGGQSAESYVFEIKDVSAESNGKNQTELRNMVTGASIILKEEGDTKDVDVGSIILTSVEPNEEGTTGTNNEEKSTIKISASSGTVYADRIFTAEGLEILLPVVGEKDDSVVTAENYLAVNSTDSAATWKMNFTEEDKDGTIANGEAFSIGIGIDTNDGIEASSVATGPTMHVIGRSGDDKIGYVVSDLSTKIEWTDSSTNLDAMEITYFGKETYAEVFLTSDSASSSSGSNILPIYDNEASSVTSNLIVVGGSCVNTVAATLLGGDLCEGDFTAKTGVGNGEYLIETFASPYSSKVATLVAGYNAADTTNAANALRTGSIEITEGVKYTGTTASNAEKA
jgi:hypothetical protein